ncbi:MAG: TlpA family protein disulfide reductase [Clostridia bacterium]|nr:TlpA family protein disulfide reductase [Clostridia bacterium]
MSVNQTEAPSKRGFVWLLIILLFLLAAAMFAYRYLSDRYTPDSTVGLAAGVSDSTSNGSTNAADITVSDESAALTAEDGGDASAADVIPAYDFTVYNADGTTVNLSDFYGKPILINFWATWCSPCKSELPDFDAVYGEYGEDVVFMMVNLTDGSRDTVERAGQFVSDAGYSFPVYYDCDLDAASVYGAYSIPMTVLIDADANIVGAQVGVIAGDDLRRVLDSVLAETGDDTQSPSQTQAQPSK